jgi:seryl-tRNA synthetase
MYATGFFPNDANNVYTVNPKSPVPQEKWEEDDLYLIGTAEVPLVAQHSGETFDVSELPKRYVGFSSCFRREAGTYGKDSK